MSETGKIVVGCYLQLNEQPRQNGKTLPCTRLMEENERLRELVRDIWSAYHDGATNREFRALPDRMRELGWPVVEEDE